MSGAGLALLILGACHPPTPVAPAAGAAQVSVATDAPPPASPAAHPGAIVFVDLDTGEERTLPSAEVPESIAWGSLDGLLVPVVRVESRVRGSAREITRYAADGVVLDTTVSGP